MEKLLQRIDFKNNLLKLGYHLVYAEGTKTEPFYIDGVRKQIAAKVSAHTREITLIPIKLKKSRHTVDLVRYVEKDVKKRLKNGEKINCVWIFFDKDSFDDFDIAYKMIVDKNQKEYENKDFLNADENNIRWYPCWSNECFEIWCYLHYEFLESSLSRDVYIEKINSFIKSRGCSGVYKKNDEKLFSFLLEKKGDIKKAIKFAKKLDNDSLIKPNPSTGIYLFAEYFLAYLS